MNFLEKIQNLPEKKRKIILWITAAIVALVLIIFFVKNVQNNLEKFKSDEFKEGLKNLPKFELPKAATTE